MRRRCTVGHWGVIPAESDAKSPGAIRYTRAIYIGIIPAVPIEKTNE
jgi:hypothetical protein